MAVLATLADPDGHELTSVQLTAEKPTRVEILILKLCAYREREYGSKNKLGISENRGPRAIDHLKSKRKGAQSRANKLTCAVLYALSLSAECPTSAQRERTETKKMVISEKQQINRNTMRVSAKNISVAI